MTKVTNLKNAITDGSLNKDAYCLFNSYLL